MPNIEMKARYADLNKAREIAQRLGAKFLWKDEQVDTYFCTRRGKLKLRETGLSGAELLPYVKSDETCVTGQRLNRSDYAKIPIQEPALVKELLEALLGRRLEIRKLREVHLIGNVRIHLDEVRGLGRFLEFEAVFDGTAPEVEAAECAKVVALMAEFGLGEKDLLQGSYPDLMTGLSEFNPPGPERETQV
jgi:adenylate cyclase, class 2